MRSSLIAGLSLVLAACGSPQPRAVTSGPRLEAALAATWPAAAPARQAVFSDDGRLLATSDASGLITVRDAHGWNVVEQLRHPDGATSLAFSRDGAHLFSGGYDATVREWDLAARKQVRGFTGSTGTVWTLDISPDGKRLATAGEDAVLRIWDLGRSTAPMQLRGHERNIWEVRFSPDGKRLASGSFDHSVRLWDASSSAPLHVLRGHTQAVVGLDFSPGGKVLASGADDSSIRLWRTSDGAPLRVIDNAYHVDKVEFSPDGRWLASGGHARGSIAEVWHQLTGAGGEGEAARIWRTPDGALVAALPHPEDVISLAFSPDGAWLVTSGEDNRFRLWRLRPVGG